MTPLERVAKALWSERKTVRHFVEMTLDETAAFAKRHELTHAEMDEAHAIILDRMIADEESA